MSAVGLTSHRAFLRALGAARQIELTAYVVGDGGLKRALEAAADRGARVRVTLERAPYARETARARALRACNRATVAALRRHGAEAHLTRRGEASLHLKAALLDGRGFLDDRNWTRDGDTIVATSRPSDLALIRSAFAGDARSDAHLALRKDRALELEAELIARTPAQVPIEVETESFGPSVVTRVLGERAARGGVVRLLVGARELREDNSAERAALREVRRAGVEVRACNANEKFCLAGGAGWIGSANATLGEQDALDWGMRCGGARAIASLHARFEARWAGAIV
jgi:phosphatidylserine/phosphatidylglycerophosphate/cardiolipin synthase-like enzyme